MTGKEATAKSGVLQDEREQETWGHTAHLPAHARAHAYTDVRKETSLATRTEEGALNWESYKPTQTCEMNR